MSHQLRPNSAKFPLPKIAFALFGHFLDIRSSRRRFLQSFAFLFYPFNCPFSPSPSFFRPFTVPRLLPHSSFLTPPFFSPLPKVVLILLFLSSAMCILRPLFFATALLLLILGLFNSPASASFDSELSPAAGRFYRTLWTLNSKRSPSIGLSLAEYMATGNQGQDQFHFIPGSGRRK